MCPPPLAVYYPEDDGAIMLCSRLDCTRGGVDSEGGAGAGVEGLVGLPQKCGTMCHGQKQGKGQPLWLIWATGFVFGEDHSISFWPTLSLFATEVTSPKSCLTLAPPVAYESKQRTSFIFVCVARPESE